MPPRRQQASILTGHASLGELAECVRARLAQNPWPLPPEAFPPGTALVGGAVRDALLNRLGPCPDLDLVICGDALALAQELSRQWGGTAVVLDADHGIARLVLKGWTLDLAQQAGPSLEADLKRRDFSINAIACPLAPGSALQDPTGGLAHLAAGQLVAISEANLIADPLRLLRGLRLACDLAFALAPLSEQWIHRHGALLGQVAGERVLAELEKLAAAPAGHLGLQACLNAGLLASWEVDPDGAIKLAVLDGEAGPSRGFSAAETAAALPLARLAALFNPKALGALRSSRRLQQRCGLLRQGHASLGAGAKGPGLEGLAEVDRLALHRQLESDLPALLLARPLAEARAAISRWRDSADPLFHPKPPIDGQSLQTALGLTPGRQLGDLLQHLTQERAFGRLPLAPGPSPEVLQAARAWLNWRCD